MDSTSILEFAKRNQNTEWIILLGLIPTSTILFYLLFFR